MRKGALILILVLCLSVFLAEAQKKTKPSSKSKKNASKNSNSPTSSKTTKTAKTTAPANPASLTSGPSESVKLAEQMVTLAQRLLKAVKKGEAAIPPPLCPNGQPQVTCKTNPCQEWSCSNILDAVCEAQCHVCEPKFYIRGNEVTHLCDKIKGGQNSQTKPITPSSPASMQSGFPDMSAMWNGETMPMTIGGPAPAFENMMPNFEGMPPGLSPMEFMQYMHGMQQQGESQSNNNNPRGRGARLLLQS